jgi:uncharacterized damage-inducible protein DinB
MTARQIAADQLRRAYHGNAWHGPALRELLAGIPSRTAARRPIAGAHTIWEIVLHISRWEDVVRRRLAGERIVSLPPKEDWPPVGNTTPAAWRKTLVDLRRSNSALAKAIRQFPAHRLSETVPGRKHTYAHMLHGVVQHDLYHAGQIALLKKAP